MRTREENGHRSAHFSLLEFRFNVAVDKRQDITQLLAAWADGDQEALNYLISAVYPEIRKIARQRLRHTPQQTLESAAVANEAYVRLFQARGIQCENRLMFFALCAQVIRRIIGEYARRQRYAKRGGSAVRVPLDDALVGGSGCDIQVMALDQALESLRKMDQRKGSLVELHCFGGLTIDESAEILKVSPETAKRDWKIAKAWLFAKLNPKRAE
jgi:RNA polymerase sigma-70 factor (ECF subfamily)